MAARDGWGSSARLGWLHSTSSYAVSVGLLFSLPLALWKAALDLIFLGDDHFNLAMRRPELLPPPFSLSPCTSLPRSANP
jgi:hypothetical protein